LLSGFDEDFRASLNQFPFEGANMKIFVAVAVCTVASFCTSPRTQGQSAAHIPLGVASDWTQRHTLFPASNNPIIMSRVHRDPRWAQNWFLHHHESWWPGKRRTGGHRTSESHRDWSTALGNATFEPLFDYSFDIASQAGYGSLNTTELNGEYLATDGTLTVTAGNDIGTYSLYPGGPGQTLSPMGSFYYDNLLFPFYPTTDPPLDIDGLLFTSPSVEINIWGNGAGNYSYYDSTSGGVYGTQLNETGTIDLNVDPGGGQTFPAKYVFDVTASPSCSGDFVVLGIPAAPKAAGQANIVGYNNLYSTTNGTGYCPGTGPKMLFAYASGSGEVPASIALSLNGTQIAYIENLLTGSSYFHVLTLGTTGTNGASATAAVVPGSAGGNNAVDQRVLLSPDGGITNQGSTSAPFVTYSSNAAYVTTHSYASAGSGYLYKITNVFGGGTPAIAWRVAINAVPSSPVYDSTSNSVFFTDSEGRIDSVADTGGSPTVTYGSVVAPGATSLNPVTVDSVNEMVYATFNTNGLNALVVQEPTTLSKSYAVPVGTGSTTYTGPYGVDFNNAWYTGSGTPLLYVAGKGTGTSPTLYSVGFNASGVLNSTASSSAALTTGMGDVSPITEFYNATLGEDLLFVGVTNNCIATTQGGTAGCVMSLNITNGFPTVNASTTAIAAAGGSTAFIVDNDSNDTQASSVYYATKTGATLVKATQAGLN
jgi:hypothetical protein